MRAKPFLYCLLFAAGLAGATSHAQTDARLWGAAQSQKIELLRDLATLVNLDTGTDDAAGLDQAAAFLARQLRDLGAVVELRAAPPAAGQIVLGTLHGDGGKNFLLMVHYDTVFGVGEARKRPYSVVGNKAYGPGVADAKGGAQLIVHALRIARARGFRDYKTLTVLFNPDEEKSSLGSRDLLREVAAKNDVVLSFEPPDGDRVIIATNGIAYVNLAVKGLSSHAGSAPEKGRNAALELAHQVMQLRALGDEAKGTTVNWTMLQAGERANIIPDRATATADMRMADVAEIARVQTDAERLIATHLIAGTEVSVTVEKRRPPFARNPATDRLAAMADEIYRELGRRVEPVAMRYGTDAGFAYLPGGAGPAVLDGMGIVGDRLHSPDEWADLDSVAPRLYLTVRMLELLSRKIPLNQLVK